MRRMWILAAAAAALVLLLTACQPNGRVVDVGAAPTSTADGTAPPTTGDATQPSERAAPTVPAQADGGDAAAPDGDDAPPGDATLPGDPVDLLFTDGEVGVVGVEADDVLNVRARPGVGEPIIARLDPLRRGLTYTGRARQIDRSIWTEITFDGERGWVNSRFARLIAGTDDITSQLLGSDEVIGATTLPELAEDVVTAYGLADGYRIVWGPDKDPSVAAEEQRRVVISDGPQVGDLGEITIDVVDLYDDSIAAERLTIFARPADGGFDLRTVERTFFCWRGGDDFCV